MSKSVSNYKTVFFLILNIFFSIISFAQADIVGKWKTKDIIGYTNVKEYSLSKEKEPNYGRRLTFKLDGTFLSNEPIQCPNGCTVFTSGTYALDDNDHIRIIVEDVRFVGFYCGMQRSHKEEYVKDLGVFYIYKEGDSIRLIPSNGVLQDDKDKMLYTEMVDTFYKDWKKYDYVWKNSNGNNPEEIINDCVNLNKEVDLSNCKVVFSRRRGDGEFYILRKNEEFHYVIYNPYDKKVSLAYPKNRS
ncbi:hypothetical protein [Flavobacterium sp. 270]|uniref:hypothetical protein n=1 Tax=Flavobacterium sp. 270 TaxID=2512114 RepID=UPI001065AD57|nr:hypothetical protein [Flavobacterium sp. 270]